MHRLLDGYRCVTITGPGGVGKTRLAVEVAADRSDRGPVPIAWVPLAAVADPTRVAEAVVGALKLRVDHTHVDAVADALVGRELLLVLDQAQPDLRLRDLGVALDGFLAPLEFLIAQIPERQDNGCEEEQNGDERTERGVTILARRGLAPPPAAEQFFGPGARGGTRCWPRPSAGSRRRATPATSPPTSAAALATRSGPRMG